MVKHKMPKSDLADKKQMEVWTDFDKNTGLIRMTVEIGYNMFQSIVDTRQGKFRQALIEMGWTPPVGEDVLRVQ